MANNYNLIKRDGTYYVEGLKDDWCKTPDTILLVRYDAGDCDSIVQNDKNMHSALYDLYQTSDSLKDGDTFSLDGKVVYVCQGVDVIPYEAD